MHRSETAKSTAFPTDASFWYCDEDSPLEFAEYLRVEVYICREKSPNLPQELSLDTAPARSLIPSSSGGRGSGEKNDRNHCPKS
jgi:hypothetical protein